MSRRCLDHQRHASKEKKRMKRLTTVDDGLCRKAGGFFFSLFIQQSDKANSDGFIVPLSIPTDLRRDIHTHTRNIVLYNSAAVQCRNSTIYWLCFLHRPKTYHHHHHHHQFLFSGTVVVKRHEVELCPFTHEPLSRDIPPGTPSLGCIN